MIEDEDELYRARTRAKDNGLELRVRREYQLKAGDIRTNLQGFIYTTETLSHWTHESYTALTNTDA